MMSVLYRNRALPLCWQVIKAKKGHCAQEAHRELLAKAKALVPLGRAVVFLGDGEFDGPDLLADAQAAGWHFVINSSSAAPPRTRAWPKPIGPAKPFRCLRLPCSPATAWN